MSEYDKHKGGIFLHRGDLARARHWYEQALRDDRQSGTADALTETLGNLGNVCLGKTYLLTGKRREAEKCLNNASEHFIKLGNEHGEAAVLRVLADVYEQAKESIAAVRCLERVVLIDRRYGLDQAGEDADRLERLRRSHQ